VHDEIRGAAIVDRRGVDAEDADLALLDEQAGGVFAEAGKAQLRGVARSVVAHVRLNVRPVGAPARAQQDDGSLADGTVLLLELQHVGARQAVVAVGDALLRDVDHDRARGELLERHFRGAALAFGEVDRRVQVRAAVLGRAQRVG
jgi:hypothetical protein